MKTEKLSLPIPREVFSFNDAENLMKLEDAIKADGSLDPDYYVASYASLNSNDPLRIFCVPTQSEIRDHETMMISKLGVMSLYWKEFANAIIDPDKLWKRNIIHTTLIPAFFDTNDQIRLTVYPYQEEVYRPAENARYTQRISTINYGGDGDFFSQCTAGSFLVPRNKTYISAQDLGITAEQRQQIYSIHNALNKPEGDVYENAVLVTLARAANDETIFDKNFYRWLRLAYLEGGLRADWLVLRKMFHDGLDISDDVFFDKQISVINRQYKQNLLDEGKDGLVYRTAYDLAMAMQDIYDTAVKHTT